MTESGNYSSGSGYDVPSNLPTEVEQDCHPTEETTPLETQTAHGNFLSTHHPNIGDRYSSRHPLVTGHSTFTNPNVSIFCKNNNDIIPEISNVYDGYKTEVKRLETFHDWPSNAFVSKENLARNGFIYMHVNDRTQCVFCRAVLSGWEAGDVVENEHKRHCPECPFAFGYECGNIPLNSVITLERQNATSNPHNSQPQFYLPTSQPQSFNTTLKIPVSSRYPLSAANVYSDNVPINGELHPTNGGRALNTLDSRPSLENLSLHSSSLPPIPMGQVRTGQETTNEPKYRDWGDEYKRIRSFKGWPAQMTQTPMELAKAGLLYMGTGDRCKCFWCGSELYDWEPQDTPWEEHAKWFSHCGYVRAMKGDQYIQYVRDRQNGLVVDPPVQEVMRTPHVLAVLSAGYTQDQVEEAFNRFGRGRLVDAPSIVQAIEQTKLERRAILNESNKTAGTQETVTLVMLPDEDEQMETENPSQNTLTSKATTTVGKISESKTLSAGTPATTADSSSSTDVEYVMKENEKLKDMKLCKICMDNELCMTFLPCGHLATCEECSLSLQECPICRKAIMQRVKIFWA